MKLRKLVLAVAALVVGLPLAAMLTAIVWISWLDRSNGTLVVAGESREYRLHVPDSYDPARQAPLVISLHAGATWPAHQMNLTRWNRLADRHGFLVVYPAGTPQLFGVVRIWRTTPETVTEDVRFVAALIDRLEGEYTIDPARIYADGMSMGGALAVALACTLPDRVAAVGAVAAAQELPPSWCPDPRPVPMMVFHGDADRLVPYAGGPLGDPFNPVKPVYFAVRDWVAGRARINRCAASPVESAIAPDVARLEFPDCAEDAAVVLYTLAGGGHSWPGGKPPPEWRVGATNANLDASAELWAFFARHPLRQAAPETP